MPGCLSEESMWSESRAGIDDDFVSVLEPQQAASTRAGARLSKHHDFDVVILAECGGDTTKLISSLNETKSGDYSFPFALNNNIHIFTRLPEGSITELADDNLRRVSMRRLIIASAPELLLVAVHLRSRVNWSASDQSQECPRLAREIALAEDRYGHRRTIVVGDLNMNPFDDGVVAAQGLHAVMTQADARRRTRTVEGQECRFFYNPMWSYFGDRSDGPPGTYYLKSSKPINYFWNIYDQVLLRPEIMDQLADLRIIDSDGTHPLVDKRGLPSTKLGSDHLPILFRLSI